MFKLKTIDFDKIRSMVDAAERLVDADLKEEAETTLVKLAYFINKDIKDNDNTQEKGDVIAACDDFKLTKKVAGDLKRLCRDPNEPIEEMLRIAFRYLKAPLPKIEGLRAALNNVCEPQKDVVVHCPECRKDHVTHNGEWFLWCGDKAHADALIEAARAYLEASEGI